MADENVLDGFKLLNPDFLMANLNNKCNETQKVIDEEQDWFRPSFSPFYGDTMEVRNGSGEILTLDKEYKLRGLNKRLSHLTGVPVYMFVEVLDFKRVMGSMEFDYRSLGVHGVPLYKRDGIISAIIDGASKIDWETQVIGKPNSFPGLDHIHSAKELTGYYYLIALAQSSLAHYSTFTARHFNTHQKKLLLLAQQINENRTNFINKVVEHDTDYNNPHKLTKYDIGLSSIANLPLSTEEDANSIKRNSYSTPKELNIVLARNDVINPIHVRNGDLPIDGFYFDDHTQNLFHPDSKFVLNHPSGCWKSLPNGGFDLLANFNKDNDTATTYINVSNTGNVTDTYFENPEALRVINCFDGSLIVREVINNGVKSWEVELTATSKVFRIQLDRLPTKEKDFIANTSCFLMGTVVYFTYNTIIDDTPALSVYKVDTFGERSTALLIPKLFSLTNVSSTTPEDEIKVFKIEKENDKFTHFGKPLGMECDVIASKHILDFVEADLENNAFIVKYIYPIKINNGTKSIIELLESSIYIECSSGDYQEVSETSIPLSVKVDFDKDLEANKVDRLYSYFYDLTQQENGVKLNVNPEGLIMFVSKYDGLKSVQLPYSSRTNISFRSWFKYLDNVALNDVSYTYGYDTATDDLDVLFPCNTYVILSGSRYPIKRRKLNFRRLMLLIESTDADISIYAGLIDGEAKLIPFVLGEQDRSGLVKVATVTIENLKITDITLFTDVN